MLMEHKYIKFLFNTNKSDIKEKKFLENDAIWVTFVKGRSLWIDSYVVKYENTMELI